MKNKLIQFLSVILIIVSFSLCFNNSKANLFAMAQTNQEVESSAKAVAVIELNSNRLLLQKNAQTKLAMASTTKIMTAIVAIENCLNLDERFIVDSSAIGTYGSSMYLQEGEEVSLKELLYGLMLVSGNDAAMAIACRISNGNIDNFVSLMNEKAQSIDCLNTHFDNPHGLDSLTHYTTAYDLAKITSYALKNETFQEIVKTKTIKIGDRYLKNKQKILFLDPTCTGVKTGFTDNALRCSVSSFSCENSTLICVVLNCADMFEESLRLIDIAKNMYSNYEILKPYTTLHSISINKGKKAKTWAINTKGLTYPLSQDEKNKIKIDITCENIIEAPLKKGSNVGKVKVYIDNILIFETNLCTIEEIEKENVLDKVNRIIKEIF